MCKICVRKRLKSKPYSDNSNKRNRILKREQSYSLKRCKLMQSKIKSLLIKILRKSKLYKTEYLSWSKRFWTRTLNTLAKCRLTKTRFL